MKQIVIIILISLFSTLTAYSQEADNGAMSWGDFVNIMSDEADDDKGPDSELFEDLYELHNHPMNLNDITEEDLHQLPFLSEDDRKNIMFYIDNHRPVMSTGELMFVFSLDRQKRLMMQLFCYAGEYKHKDFSLKNILKYSKNELTIRTDIPFYTKTGYKDVPDSILQKNPNKIYQGNRLYHSLHYNISSQKHFFAGLQMEKDAGERYIDHFAGYVMLKNIGHVQTAIIGNYRVSFGHGLVINTGSSFGKAMKLSSMEVIDRGFFKHSSTSETGYFTGGATTLNYEKIKVSAYISYRKTDGTYNSDSTGLTSLKTDGLHRTMLEISKKNNISILDFGGNIHFDFNRLQVSVTAAATHLNEPLSPKYNTKSSYYRQYNPQGKNFAAYSIAYAYRYRKLFFSGETAINSSHAIATLNQLQWTPNSLNTITIIQRYYGAKYNALNARSFGENPTVHNESGLYFGWNSELINKINIKAYVDAMYFPWLKYQVYGSSYGIEGLAQITYTPSSKHALILRYRIKSKQRDHKIDSISTLTLKNNHNLKIQYNLTALPKWSLRTTLTGTYISFAETKSKGIAIGETFRYTPINNLRIDASVIYFNTDSYDSRIYNYESSLLYSFAMSSYYGKGIRGILLISWKILDNLSLTAKLATTAYLNMKSIGTGLEEINSKHKEDFQLQIRWKF